jgi:hypothetical protein
MHLPARCDCSLLLLRRLLICRLLIYLTAS